MCKTTLYDTMRNEAREAIIECLEDGYTGYYCDLHNEVFNTGWYRNLEPTTEQDKIKAATLLGTDVYEAIGRIYEYEKDNFGEALTDLSNPARILNMLYYIIGEEVLYEEVLHENSEVYDILLEKWNDEADEETNRKLVEKLENNERN